MNVYGCICCSISSPPKRSWCSDRNGTNLYPDRERGREVAGPASSPIWAASSGPRLVILNRAAGRTPACSPLTVLPRPSAPFAPSPRRVQSGPLPRVDRKQFRGCYGNRCPRSPGVPLSDKPTLFTHGGLDVISEDDSSVRRAPAFGSRAP